MQLDILSQNLAIYTCLVLTVATSFILFKLFGINTPHKKKLKKKKNKKPKKLTKADYLILFKKYINYRSTQLALGIILSFVLAIIIDLLVGRATDSILPTGFVLMCLPFTLLVCVSILAFIKAELRVISVVVMCFGILFSLILINDYYRYFPTFGEVFGQTDALSFKGNLSDFPANYGLGQTQKNYNSSSLETNVDKLPNDPSAGTLYKVNIPGTVSKFNARPGYVYVPAIYSNLANQINLPVIVLSAGVPGDPANWPDSGLETVMNDFASTHNGISPIVVVADNSGGLDNDTECVNSPRGNVETYLTVDVPNYIKANFNVDSSPKNWAIGGLSMGGMCAIMLTLRHPDVYNYFIDLGGEVGPEDGSKQKTIATLFNGSKQAWAAHQPLQLLASKKYTGLGGYFGDGNQDNPVIINAQKTLNAASKKAGLNTVYETVDGAHTFEVWTETFKDSLPWISNRIGATTCSASCI